MSCHLVKVMEFRNLQEVSHQHVILAALQAELPHSLVYIRISCLGIDEKHDALGGRLFSIAQSPSRLRPAAMVLTWAMWLVIFGPCDACRKAYHYSSIGRSSSVLSYANAPQRGDRRRVQTARGAVGIMGSDL